MRRIFFLCAALVILGCGEKAKMGKAKVSLGNASGASLVGAPGVLPEGATGSVRISSDSTYVLFPAKKMAFKMIQIYLIENVNGWDNDGNAGYIWINPACPAKEEENGSISLKAACPSSQIPDYFELARSADEVNAELNSQEVKVKPGTYRYIRVQVCDNGSVDKNIRFAGGGVATEKEATTGNCVLAPALIDPPVELGENEVVEIALGYDLNTALIDLLYNLDTGRQGTPAPDNTPKECVYTDNGESNLCFHDITFKPTATKR